MIGTFDLLRGQGALVNGKFIYSPIKSTACIWITTNDQ